MRTKKYTKFMGDFETTVYEGQEFTEVWASALVPFYSEDVKIFHSLDETYKYLLEYPGHVQVYYHNLKFDGEFWIAYLLKNGFKAAVKGSYDTDDLQWKKEKEMLVNEYKYFISDRGQWYYIIIKTNNGFIELRDSLKLLPFSVREIGKGFNTKHQKLDMEYKGFRYAGCEITPEEQEYIKNDVLVVKEALEFLAEDGHDKLTIGSCCFKEFKTRYNADTFKELFPNVYEYPINQEHGADNIGQYIRRSYKGGWCYVLPEKQNKTLGKGCTVDVNSLYPSMMHSMSGNYYPVGLPKFWTGNFIPEDAIDERKYFFVRIKTRFTLNEGYLPFIQIKGTWLYKGTENLTTSDIYDYRRKEYFREYIDGNGEVVQAIPILTLTMTDYYLFLEHYNVEDFEILDGCYFEAKKGLFDGYIDKYREIKQTSKGAKRSEAKLFLTNLYGKMATSPESRFKMAELDEEGVVEYYINDDTGKKPGYIPIASAITSYARNFTIRAAQKNYHPGKGGFCYADTDSLHCDLSIGELAGIELDDNEFCKWAHENDFDKARFVRQKTYIEISGDDYIIKCAGMPQKSKDLFLHSILQDYEGLEDTFTEEELEFIKKKRTINDFKRGLKVPGKLRPKHIPGGVVLVDVDYEIR